MSAQLFQFQTSAVSLIWCNVVYECALSPNDYSPRFVRSFYLSRSLDFIFSVLHIEQNACAHTPISAFHSSLDPFTCLGLRSVYYSSCLFKSWWIPFFFRFVLKVPSLPMFCHLSDLFSCTSQSCLAWSHRSSHSVTHNTSLSAHLLGICCSESSFGILASPCHVQSRSTLSALGSFAVYFTSNPQT